MRVPVCAHTCVCKGRVFCRFGVIHSVFTNLLLWANSVLNESKHQLNEHKERLITLGFGNITIGECVRGRAQEACRHQHVPRPADSPHPRPSSLPAGP